MDRRKSLAVLAGLLFVTELLPGLVRLLGAPDWDPWYAGLAKPSWTPPDWVVPVVWPTLYLLMAVAAWLVWRAARGDARGALTLYGVQLVVNASWSWVFGGLKSLLGGFLVILLLWSLLVGTIAAFARYSRPAAWLLVPYLAWVTFAAVLNYAVWRLNAS